MGGGQNGKEGKVKAWEMVWGICQYCDVVKLWEMVWGICQYCDVVKLWEMVWGICQYCDVVKLHTNIISLLFVIQ